MRALWRILIQIAAMFLLGALPILLIAEPLTALHRRGIFLAGYDHDHYDRVINTIIGPILTAAVIASVVLAARWLDRRPLAFYGVILDRAWWRNLAIGFGIGASLMLLVFLAEYAVGWIEITGSMARNVAGVSLGLAFLFTFVKVICVGTYEELVSRGYLLRNLADGIGLPAAVVISSLIFAALHLTNDNSSLLSTAGLFVNSLLFTAAVLTTRRLAAAIGVHMSWNLFQGAVFGFPVSGDKEGASLVGIHQIGPSLMTGGAFGPEAGLIGVMASLAGIAAFLLLRRPPEVAEQTLAAVDVDAERRDSRLVGESLPTDAR